LKWHEHKESDMKLRTLLIAVACFGVVTALVGCGPRYGDRDGYYDRHGWSDRDHDDRRDRYDRWDRRDDNGWRGRG